jgi:hypothetical protein
MPNEPQSMEGIAPSLPGREDGHGAPGDPRFPHKVFLGLALHLSQQKHCTSQPFDTESWSGVDHAGGDGVGR